MGSSSSPTESDLPFHHHLAGQDLPVGNITSWSEDDVADYISSLGLGKYSRAFIENGISGDTLVALNHDELRDMGINSVGHRITILKNVYFVKMNHDVPIADGDYVPVSVDAETNSGANQAATQSDIQRLVHHIKERDERIVKAEEELKKMHDLVAKLREEILPLYRLVKEKAPLPTPSAARTPGAPEAVLISTPPAYTSEPTPNRDRDRDRDIQRDQAVEPPAQPPPQPPPQPPSQPSGGLITRKFSTKRLFLGTPKNKSPTHQSHQEKSEYDTPAGTNGTSNSYIPPPPSNTNLPSPKSPNHNLSHQTSSNGLNTARHRDNNNTNSYVNNDTQPNASNNSNAASSGSQPTVEIFKSFRVSMDDPCYKVLPAALKRYNIQADWRQYALYIVYGDQERCLELDERPLILFKQLDREGRKPMFMLRRNATATEGINLPPGGII